MPKKFPEQGKVTTTVNSAALTQIQDVTDPQRITLHKQTTIQAFSPEEELTRLVSGGEWELVLNNESFQKRSPESQVQLFREALDQRILSLRKSLYLMINRGPNQRAAAMGILERIRKLEQLRDDSLQDFYENGMRSLAEKAGVKIEFY